MAASTMACTTSPSATLDGQTYLSTAIAGADLVPGTRIRLSFQDGTLGASAGCNSMGGAYRLEGDRLVVGPMSMTEMGCEEPLMQQDAWLAAFLGGATVSLDADTLLLANGAVSVTFLDAEVATPDLPIEGTRWVLDGIVMGDAVSSVPVGVTAAIRITGGRIDVESGCNSGGGAVEVTADTIRFGPIALTKRACEAGPAAVEQAVMAVLSAPVGYVIDADLLRLDAGASGLIFRASP
jgi:heat shock protein HslJ